MYLLAHSERMPSVEDYVERIRGHIRSLNRYDSNTCVAVKAHPRERNGLLVAELKASRCVRGVVNRVPAELLVGICKSASLG